ncbi:MAG TPA: PQQ-binding-like beta-propeller repeat protein [Tepidisphaeraceae bacterium]|nr:PQQ-binding-like beta-propeller repeat protein [Tepidisphaeraceae bacterium]
MGLLVLLTIVQVSAAASWPQPWVGVHVTAGNATSLDRVRHSIPGLAKLGVNALILEVDYGFQFASHPELNAPGNITKEQAKSFAQLCRENHIRLIPSLNCLGHQSWAQHTAALLAKHPELDETPGKFPDNQGIYCRSWCPLNPQTNQIVFPLIDELIDAFDADAFHVGMDEVFILADEDCPRCKGKNPAELFAKQVNDLHRHLVDERKVEMFMWADRLLDAKAMGYSRWEAAINGTGPAVGWIPKDIVLCDWHYAKRTEYKSIPFLLSKGFRVWPAGWHEQAAVAALLVFSLAQNNPRMVGYLSTTWGRVRLDALDSFVPTKMAAERFRPRPEPVEGAGATSKPAQTLDWPGLRGPTGQGRADAAKLPLTWSETQNVRFKTEIPGRGWSSPVICQNQIWMTTATEEGHSLRAICVDKESGKILHDVEVFRPETLQHSNDFNSYASPTPVIEPGRVYVCFGAYGSACLDTSTAEPIWKNEELKLYHMEGPGSSPVLYKDLYILHCDGMDVQYVAALDKQTGKIAWRTRRSTRFGFTLPPFRKAYGTPLIVEVDGKDQLISPAARRLFSYDAQTGTELWHVDLEPPAYSTAPVPVFADGVVYACTGFEQPQLWAVRVTGASGDVTKSNVLWKFKKGVPLRSSPILVDGLLYFTSDGGILRCLDAKTGQPVYQTRLGDAYSASPIYADGRLYFFSQDSGSFIVKPGRSFELLAHNDLTDGCMASPAVSGSALFVRTKSALYRIDKASP